MNEVHWFIVIVAVFLLWYLLHRRMASIIESSKVDAEDYGEFDREPER